ncbi:MAG: hypothetical protein ACHREM_04075 [Polyangiales bacterium]
MVNPAALVSLALRLSEAYSSAATQRAVVRALVLSFRARSYDEAAIVLGVQREESQWDGCAVGPRLACGGGQIEQPGLWGSTCSAMCTSTIEDVDVTLAVVRYSTTHCRGTWFSALTQYVSGTCGVGVDEARARCASVDLCDVAAREER